MSARGGSVLEVSIRGRIFPVISDADLNIKFGGYENEQRANGDSSTRTIQTLVPWAVTGLVLSMDLDRGDAEFVQEIADAGENVDVTISLVGGVTLQADGLPVGELQYQTMNASMPVDLSGPGKATRQ